MNPLILLIFAIIVSACNGGSDPAVVSLAQMAPSPSPSVTMAIPQSQIIPLETAWYGPTYGVGSAGLDLRHIQTGQFDGQIQNGSLICAVTFNASAASDGGVELKASNGILVVAAPDDDGGSSFCQASTWDLEVYLLGIGSIKMCDLLDGGCFQLNQTGELIE